MPWSSASSSRITARPALRRPRIPPAPRRSRPLVRRPVRSAGSRVGSYVAATSGTQADTRRPRPCPVSTVTVPPAARTRSVSPRIPVERLAGESAGTASPPTPSSAIDTEARPGTTSMTMRQAVAWACRSTLVTASRTTHPNVASAATAGGSGSGPSTTPRTPAARSASSALASSSARPLPRYPATACRTWLRARRPIASMSLAWATTASGSSVPVRRTASALTTMRDSEWPRRSCRSRDIRWRSSRTATAASWARVRWSSATTSVSR